MIASSFLFAVMNVLVKHGTHHVPFMQVVFFRSAITLLVLLPIMIKQKIPFLGRQKTLLFFRGTFGFLSLAFTFYVTTKITLADMSLLNRTSTLFVVILAGFFLKEKISWKLYVYVLIAFIGTGFIIKPGLDVMNSNGFLGILGGLFAALAYVSVKKLLETEAFYTIVFSFGFVATFFSLLFSAADFVIPSLANTLVLLGVGLIGTYAQILMTSAYKYGDASVVNPYSFSTVLFSALFGYLLWGEMQDSWSLFGGALIIFCGVQISSLQKNKVV